MVASGCAEISQAPPAGPVWKCDDALDTQYQQSPNVVVGAPINTAVVDDSARLYTAIRFDDDASGNIVASTFATGIVASSTQSAVVDATGDGLPDVVTVFGCRFVSCEFNTATAGRTGTVQNASYVEGAWINRNLGTATDIPGNGQFEYAGYDLMNAAENGLGVRHEWTYRPLSSDAYDTANSDFYKTVHADEIGDPDYFHFASSMNVVADYRASNGIGGMNSIKYRYRGAIFNNKGFGFQGVLSIMAEEDVYADAHPLATTDKITRTDFHQKWPLSSIVKQSCTWIGLGHLYSVDDNPNCFNVLSKTTTHSIHDVVTTGIARFVAIDSQSSWVYDLAFGNAELTAKTTSRSFDVMGNVLIKTQTHSDDWTINATTTSSNYLINEPIWWIDRLVSRKVICADGNRAYVGSANLSRHSKETSKELGMLVSGRAALRVNSILDKVRGIAIAI